MAIDLKSIARTTRASQPPRLVIHGVQGVGKTTLAANAYKPIFLPFEDGLVGLECDAFPLLTSYEQAIEALDALLAGGHEYGTVAIDSLDWLEPLIWARVAKDNGKENIEQISYGKGYLEATDHWRGILNRLSALRAAGMAIILIAHTKIQRFEDPSQDAFDRYELKLHKSASALVVEWADVVGLAQTETAIRKEKAGFSDRVRGVATGRRVLRVGENPAYVAKNRFSLPETLPLSWEALMTAITNPQQPTTTAAA